MHSRAFPLSDEVAAAVLPPVQFDGLCLQAGDAPAVAAFWAAALGGTATGVGGGHWRVTSAPGRPAREFIRVVPVPWASLTPSRVHVDICLPGADPGPLESMGAKVLRRPGTDPWFVLADPENNEFCAYPAVDTRPPGIFELVVKCRDALALAQWWANLLGGSVSAEGEAAAVVGAPDFPWDYMVFDPVPEPKATANRLHWHVDLRDRTPDTVIAAGAVPLRKPDPNAKPSHWVLADPEGNEFCAAAAPR